MFTPISLKKYMSYRTRETKNYRETMKEAGEKRNIARLQVEQRQTQKAPSRLDSGRKIYHKYSQNEAEIMKHPEYTDTVVCLYAKGLCTFPHRLC